MSFNILFSFGDNENIKIYIVLTFLSNTADLDFLR